MVIYRSATFDDVEKLHKLLNDYAAEGLMLPRSRNSIYENLRDYVVAVENNHVIGCGALHFVWDRLAEIRSLAVDPERKTQGIGRKMVELLEAEGIERGVDMFDCVMPTRNGRNGMLFTKDGIINMRNKKWETDFSPIEADGASAVDTLYSKAYLRHLFHAQELLAMQIASIHNLAFYLWLVGEARKHIIAGDFSTWKPMMVKRVSTRL